MKEFNEEEFNKDWLLFWKNIEECGLYENLSMAELNDAMKVSPCAISEDTGVAYPGGLLRHIVLSTAIARKINKMMSNFHINEESVVKVCSLMHLGKIGMYVENTGYSVKNGYNYTFNPETKGKLKFGERSILYAMRNNIDLNEEEFEAIRCYDKKSEDNKADWLDSPLSMIVRQANELAYASERIR